MKKIISIFILAILLFVSGCNEKNGSVEIKETVNAETVVFEAAKMAYESIHEAKTMLEYISLDVYKAWEKVVYEDYRELNLETFASEMYLSEQEVREGMIKYVADRWDDSEPFSESMQEKAVECYFWLYSESALPHAATFAVIGAYDIRGDIQEIRNNLEVAKQKILEISETNQDYEHYSNLKEYYAAVYSLYELSINPVGTSFKNINESFGSYKNTAREYENKLAFYFE